MVVVGPVGQTNAYGLVTIDAAPGIGQLTHHAVTDDARQALQRADIGGHAHVDFLDRKLCIDRAVTHIAGADQIDGATDAVALNRRQHGFAAVVDSIEGGLQLENLAPQRGGVATDILAQLSTDRGQQHQIDARGKVLAGTGKHHHADRIVVIDPLEDLDDLAPEVGIHGVDLVRSVDLHVSDFAHQLDAEGFVVGHGRHPQQRRGSAMIIL